MRAARGARGALGAAVGKSRVSARAKRKGKLEKYLQNMLGMLLKFVAIVTSVSFGPHPPTPRPDVHVLSRAANGRFVGGLMGVSADVRLCVGRKTANIELSGIPLGGTLKGVARFQNGHDGDVLVDEPLKTQLRRRFVKIVEARYDEDRDKVFVTVKLPLLLGTQTILLGRAEEESGGLFSDCFIPL